MFDDVKNWLLFFFAAVSLFSFVLLFQLWNAISPD